MAARDAGALGVVLHWTDGDISAIAEHDVHHVEGKHLDQLAKIELMPNGGGQFDKTLEGGRQVRVLELNVPGLPCEIRIVLPMAIAQELGSNLAGKPYIETASSLDSLGL